jgi:hypothetical protein
MTADELHEKAKNGDLFAIASLVQQAFTTEIQVDAKMQLGVTLWLKLKASKGLDSQNCSRVISRVLNEIKPEKITSVRISQTSLKIPQQQNWNRFLVFRQGSFVDNTESSNRIANALYGVAGILFLFAIFTYKPNSTTSASSENTSLSTSSASSTSSRIFLGRSQTGYELWADKRCVYVKGITEADLARLNTDVWGFKDSVKAQTGYKCVLFE